ncbi:hypothetical protein F9278_11155 [Streptomyces phaeolivaceus]|uniref:Uncharacterized protein n=1 Tax=Streptomyces phaeolivaceus TaxID=2653200 RepID=A0A5P8K256_9ACTN|nr:hypothetical protein F9278_11155 [Streptomyces phaeolivaceus]
MMPSVTVPVSSDTDIYISPGLYGDCLPTIATAGAPDSFRGARIRSRLSSCSHMAGGTRPEEPAGIHVTSTLWASST